MGNGPAEQAYVALKGAQAARSVRNGDHDQASIQLNEALAMIRETTGMDKKQALDEMIDSTEQKLDFLRKKRKNL